MKPNHLDAVIASLLSCFAAHVAATPPVLPNFTVRSVAEAFTLTGQLSTGESGSEHHDFQLAPLPIEMGLLLSTRILAKAKTSYRNSVSFASPGELVLRESGLLDLPSVPFKEPWTEPNPYSYKCVGTPCQGAFTAIEGYGLEAERRVTFAPDRFNGNDRSQAILEGTRGGAGRVEFSASSEGSGGVMHTEIKVDGSLLVEHEIRPWTLAEHFAVAPGLDPLNVLFHGRTVTAKVRSNFGMSAPRVAAKFGYTNFNWVQQIVAAELDGKPITAAEDLCRTVGRPLGVDPIDGPNPCRFIWYDPEADRQPYYWDQDGAPRGATWLWSSNDSGLAFQDTPFKIVPGLKLYFITEFVAVRPDGGHDVVPRFPGGGRMGFRWTATAYGNPKPAKADGLPELTDNIVVAFDGWLDEDTLPAPTALDAVEYHHAAFDHYFLTSSAQEIASLDAGQFAGWQRTGESFKVLPLTAPGAAHACRFFSDRFAPRSSHFYTPFTSECSFLQSANDWQYEGAVFALLMPDASGGCATGQSPLYRLYNNGKSGAPNHRYTRKAEIQHAMQQLGWVPEGMGAKGVIACVPT